jgi:nucleoside 2-deoxyribosyltransferase
MIIEAPNKATSEDFLNKKIFLAGTIDNGESINWQNEIANYCDSIGFTVFNPRRKDWNKTPSKNELDEQISWELKHMEMSDIILMNILGDSKSPISLLELGLYAREKKLIVFCPKSFYRYDNVEVTCKLYNVPLFSFENYEDNINAIKEQISLWQWQS